MEPETKETVPSCSYPHNHLIYGLLDDLLVYVFNYLQIRSIIQLKLTSKYLNKIISDNHQSYHYFHMQTLEIIFTNTKDNNMKYKLMECFKSIKSLETVINLNRILPISALEQSDEYKQTKLFAELPPNSFYEEYITQFLSQLHKLEYLVVNGCFDDVALKLPFQPRLRCMTVRNTESSNLLSSFFHRLLTAQFNIPTTASITDDTDDKKHIKSWCKILHKAEHHTLRQLKVYNFVASIQTLYNVSLFENLSSLHIQYDSIDYHSNKDIMEKNMDLSQAIQVIKSKIYMLCHDEDNKWSDIELFVALLFKNVLCLRNFSISGDLELDNNTLSLLMMYYALYFHGVNIHSLSIKMAIDKQLKYSNDYNLIHIYHHIMQYPFEFNVKEFHTMSMTLITATNDTDDRKADNEEIRDIKQDIDDIIIKYGNRNKLGEYVTTFPLSLQVFISLFDRYKCCMNEYGEIDTKYHLNHVNVMYESAPSYFGYYYGVMMAKAIDAYHPRLMTITPSLVELDDRDRELFINCMESMAKWCALFASNASNKDRLRFVKTLKISVSCVTKISVKRLSEFCVGDGNDMRLVNALEILAKDLLIKNIVLSIETMVPNYDTDKLRYYMRIESQIKSIGFKIDFTPNENSQCLVISYKAK